MPRKTIAELKANPPIFSLAERQRLCAISDADIDAAAAADVEHPPMSDDQLDRAIFARDVRRARAAVLAREP